MITANLVKGIHLIIVLGIILSVFVPNRQLKILALTLLIFLLVQYVLGFGTCGLTEIEYAIMGENYQQGFLYRIINPMINVDETYFEDKLLIVHLVWIGILIWQLYGQNIRTSK